MFHPVLLNANSIELSDLAIAPRLNIGSMYGLVLHGELLTKNLVFTVQSISLQVAVSVLLDFQKISK